MNPIWRLVRTRLKRHFATLAVRICIVSAVAATPYAFSFLGKWVVNEALQVTGPPQAAAADSETGEGDATPGIRMEWKARSPEDKLRLLGIFLAVSLGLHVAVTAMSAVAELLNSRMIHKMTHDLRGDVHERLVSAETAFFSREQVGQLMTRVMDDAGAIPALLINFAVNFVTETAMLVLGLVLLFRLNPKMALVAAASLPFYAVTCIYFLPRIRRNTVAIRDRAAFLSGYLVERMSNIVTVKNYAQEANEIRRFDDALDHNLGLSRKQHNLNLYFNSMTTIVTSFATLAVLGFGFLAIRSQKMQLGDVLASYQVTAQLFVPIAALVGLATMAQTLQVHASRVFGALDMPCSLDSPSAARELPQIRGDVSFENVSLRYVEGQPFAVTGIDLSVKGGEVVCLVGPTGCGKSTLLTLLTRLYDPSTGAIRIDGTDIREMPIRELRRAIGNVLYESRVFSGTVRENISYGDPETSDEEVRAAARLVGLDEFVAGLADGYETRLGIGGTMLSQEQLTRLSFARALVTKPAILTVDDTYSTIDEEGERQLRAAVHGAMKGKTVFVATTRLSICEDADRVFILQKGCVVQSGSHEQLLAEPGPYRRMYMRQMGIEELPSARAETPPGNDETAGDG